MDWLNTKSSILEWTLGLNKHASCTGITRKMEDELFSTTCAGGTGLSFLKAQAVM